MDCSFDNPNLICSTCGFDVKTIGGDATWKRNCPGPPLFKRIKNFTIAAISHALAIAPTCTQGEIDQRFSACKGCELFRPDSDNADLGVCAHSSCGCPVTREDRFVSKLGWRDQDCPLGKWPKLI